MSSATSTSIRTLRPSNTNSPSDSPFSPGSSPPLILAFLAIGLFSAAMVAVFGWRRVHFGRTATPFMMMDPLGRQLEGTGTRRRQPVYYGEPPKLWDLWTRPRDGTLRNREEDLGFSADLVKEKRPQETVEEVKWDNVMPLAVTPIQENNISNDSVTNNTRTTTPPSPPSLQANIRQRLQNLQRTYTSYRNRTRLQNNPSPDLPTRRVSEYQSDQEKGDLPSSSSSTSAKASPVQMQIAVAIAMPTPPRKGKRTSLESSFDDDERLEYMLGFCQVQCKE